MYIFIFVANNDSQLTTCLRIDNLILEFTDITLSLTAKANIKRHDWLKKHPSGRHNYCAAENINDLIVCNNNFFCLKLFKLLYTYNKAQIIIILFY